jgi:hypothetical protein
LDLVSSCQNNCYLNHGQAGAWNAKFLLEIDLLNFNQKIGARFNLKAVLLSLHIDSDSAQE